MLIAIAALLGIVGIAIGFSAFGALLRARIFRFVLGALVSVVLLAAGAVLALFSLGIDGMRALTKEEAAARIKVVPSGAQRYDGHIVKWTPLANMLGLHTSYRLDRIAGRYRALEQENTAPRTVYAIDTPPVIDLVALGRRLPLHDFFDAEYGSASYVPVAEPGEIDLMVSTTGLLLRPVAPATPRP
jgi:hypothetical protein